MSSCVKVVYTLFWFSYKFSKRIYMYMHITRTENRTGVHVRQPDVHNCTPEIIQFDHFPWAPSPPCINAMSEQFLIWFLFSVFLSLAGKRLSVDVNCNRNLLKSGRSMTVTRGRCRLLSNTSWPCTVKYRLIASCVRCFCPMRQGCYLSLIITGTYCVVSLRLISGLVTHEGEVAHEKKTLDVLPREMSLAYINNVKIEKSQKKAAEK